MQQGDDAQPILQQHRAPHQQHPGTGPPTRPRKP
jgi:hypothetical protein